VVADELHSPSAAPAPLTPVVQAPVATINRQSPQVTNRRRAKVANALDMDPARLNRLVAGVRFERKKYGFDLYWNPTGQRGRSNSTYFGRIGKRLLDQIGAGPDSAEQIRQIVFTKMREKGITA